MNARSFLRIPKHFIKYTAFAVLLGIVVFFALTRTEVGREELKQQIESQFNANYDAELAIGTLSGNLISDMYARDVQLRDAEGRLVAQIDSVVARPRWSALISQQLSLRSLDVYRPQIMLHRNADGVWNGGDLLRQFAGGESETSADEALLDLTVADIHLHQGIVNTLRAGPPPDPVERDWLFDYTQSQIRNIDARLTVEWNQREHFIEVVHLSGMLPDRDLSIDRLQGQLVGADDQWSLQQVQLQVGGSSVAFNASLGPSEDPEQAYGDPTLDLNLRTGQLNFSELQRISPRLPLSDSLEVTGQISGSLSNLSVEPLRLAHGDSYLELSGRVRDLPQTLDLDLDGSGSQLALADLRAVWPDAPLRQFDHLDLIEAPDLQLEGSVPLGPDFRTLQTRIRAAGSIISSAGDLDGVLDLSYHSDAQTHEQLHYTADVTTSGLNIAALTRNPEHQSALYGRAQLTGMGTSIEGAEANLEATFGDSYVGEHAVDSLRVGAVAQEGLFTGHSTIWHDGIGHLEADGYLDVRTDRPTYELSARSDRFNLATLPFEDAPESRLSAELELSGSGATLDEIDGTMTLRTDSSQIAHQGVNRSLLPQETTVTLTPPHQTSSPRLKVEGDIASMRLEGDVALTPLWHLGRLWGRSVAETVREEWDKPMPRLFAAADTSASTMPFFEPTAAFPEEQRHQWQAEARRALSEAGFNGAMQGRLSLEVKRSDVLDALFPRASSLHSDLDGTVFFTADAERFTMQGSLSDPLLSVGPLQTRDINIQFESAGSFDAPLDETFSSRVDVRAEEATLSTTRFRSPRLTFNYGSQQGHLRAEANGRGSAGSFHMYATLDALSDRNAITVHELEIGMGDYAWTKDDPSTIAAYADGFRVSPFTLTATPPAVDTPQQITLHGTYSEVETDTLYAEAEGVQLRPFSDLLGTFRPIGGLADGTLAMTGGFDSPELHTSVDVSWLTLGERLLGDARLTGSLDSDSPDIEIDGRLSPIEGAFGDGSDEDSVDLPDHLLASPQELITNDLSLNGRMQLPGVALGEERPSSSLLDFDVDVERAGAFFFEYIFSGDITNVEGYFTGDGEINGSFGMPLFQASLLLQDGQFRMPRFNLQYALDGPVRVNSEGIHLDNVHLAGPDGGNGLVTGSIFFNEYEFFSFDLSGALDEVPVMNVASATDLPFYGQIWASGDVTLTGPLSDATLRSDNAETAARSELYIPVQDDDFNDETGFVVFADEEGRFPEPDQRLVESERPSLERDSDVQDRRVTPAGEFEDFGEDSDFIDGLEIDLNVTAPSESRVNLVFDPIIGDVVHGVGSGRVQLQREDGEFLTFGTLELDGGSYQFTAGEVFTRQFSIDGGTITWDGDPANALLDIEASYRTRASTAGLSSTLRQQGRIPLTVELSITDRVESPRVDLGLSMVRRDEAAPFFNETLDAVFNQPDLATEFATSVLLTNTFLLTTQAAADAPGGRDGAGERLATAGSQLAFNSVSQLVASQLNEYLDLALPNLDFTLGLQGEDPQDLDVIYGVALRLMDERLIIRGEGVYQSDQERRQQRQGIEGEFVVEVRLSPFVSAEAFHRRTGDAVLNDQTLTSTTGAGLSYQTEFSTWRRVINSIFGWIPGVGSDEPPEDDEDDPIATSD